MTSPYTDPHRLREEAYPDSTNLMSRAQIYDFMVPKVDFVDWALGHLPDGLRGRVLDVGCGPGRFLTRGTRMVGLDQSLGMLREARDAVPGSLVVEGDMQGLPLRDATFDVVLCVHVLYHAADMERAVAEMARVLKPGGTALFATNGQSHIREIDALLGSPGRSSYRFDLETGANVLSTAFAVDGPHRLEAKLVVPEVGPVVRYLDSTRSLHQGDGDWDERLAEARVVVERVIADRGAFEVTIEPGVFVCRA